MADKTKSHLLQVGAHYSGADAPRCGDSNLEPLNDNQHRVVEHSMPAEKQSSSEATVVHSSNNASQKMLDETNSLQREGDGHAWLVGRKPFPHGEGDILVVSPLSAFLPSGKQVDVPDEPIDSYDHQGNHIQYQSWKTEFHPDGGSYDPYEGIDVYQKLHLKDPAKSSMFDLLPLQHVPGGESEAERSSLQLADAKAYASSAQDLLHRAPKEKLSEATLDKLAHDPLIPPAERAVAANMNLNNLAIKEGLTRFFRDIDKEDVERLAKRAEITEVSRQHTELHNPAYLADACETLIAKHDKKPMSKEWLDEAAQSTTGKFTERERAAAELLRQNYDLIASFDAKEGISAEEIAALKDTSWWTHVLDPRATGQLDNQISSPEAVKGSLNLFQGTPVLRNYDHESVDSYYVKHPYEMHSADSSSDCNALAKGIGYGATVYALESLLGNNHAAGWAMAAGAARTVDASSHCNDSK